MYRLNAATDLDALLNDIGDRPVVMLREASHGIHEFYTWRTASQRENTRDSSV